MIPNGIDPRDLRPVDDLATLRAGLRRAGRAARAARRAPRLREGLPARARGDAAGHPPRRAACASSSRASGTHEAELRGPGRAARPRRARHVHGLDRRRRPALALPDRRPLRRAELYEPFGLVALEAMASGCPCIVADTGGLREVVPNDDVGLRFRSRNPRVAGDDDDARALQPTAPRAAGRRGRRCTSCASTGPTSRAGRRRCTASPERLRRGRARGAAGPRRAGSLRRVPELLLVSTTQGLDIRDLVRALERQAPEGVTVRSAPGLLTPVRDGDGLVRDAARRRGATVVVVAPGGADVANHALLTVEGARSVGLPVAAVVVAGPGGADQRAVLREHAGAASSSTSRTPRPRRARSRAGRSRSGRWPSPLPPARRRARSRSRRTRHGSCGRSRIRAPPAAARSTRSSPRSSPPRARSSPPAPTRSTTRPRAARSSRRSRARRCRRRRTACGWPDASRSSGPRTAPRARRCCARRAARAVRVRELGPRPLDEVPLDEVAELMERLATAGANDLKRAVLDAYGLVRLTAKADEYLERALDLAGSA